MKSSDWQILNELYQTPNITKVANKLYITQPSLTKRLQRMEEIFKINIVNRTTKGVEFTSEGAYLAEKAKEYIDFMDGIHRELDTIKNKEQDVINIGSSYTYSKYYLTDILFDYSVNHPHTHFEVSNEQSQLLFQKACDKEFDAAFVCGDYEGNVVQIKVEETKGYIVTDKEYTMEEIEKMPIVDYRANDRTKELIKDWWKEIYETDMPKGTSAGYIDVAWQMVSKGIGCTCCFLYDNFENKYNLNLTPMIDKYGNHVTRNVWFVYKENKKMSSSLKDFINYVSEYSLD